MQSPDALRLAFLGCALAVITVTAAAADSSSATELTAYQQDKLALEVNPALTAIPGNLIVKFRPQTPQGAVGPVLAAARSAKVRDFSLVPGLAHVRTQLPADKAIAAITANPWVEYAEPDYVQQPVADPNDTYFGLQWGLHNTGQTINTVPGIPDADIDMPEAWDLTTGDGSFVVAIIDTGTDWSHPDLAANIWTNPGEIPNNRKDDDGNGYVDDVRGWDFYSRDNNPTDTDGHGTHTAGTVGAVGNNSVGVAGVAWHCKIMPLRFIGPRGGSTTDAIAALNYAVAKGVKVSNNSWGGGAYSQALYDAINKAKSAGHVFVAAAGNSAANTDTTPHYPSSYSLDNIVSVAATDNLDGLASFSNYGAASVDLGAPGVDIASTWTGGLYYYASGTSMAAPHVAGVAALVYQKNPGFTYAEVIDQILSTTRSVTSLAGKCVTGGVLNALDALNAGGGGGNTAPSVTIQSPDDGSTFNAGESIDFAATVSDEDSGLADSLVWTSDQDGVLDGTGATISAVLSTGTHSITASVTDSGGLTGSATVTVTIVDPDGAPPAAPSGLSAVNNKNNTAKVTWTDNADNETSFELAREKKNKNGTWGSPTSITVDPASGTGALVTVIDNCGSGTFRYSVRARNAQGDSAWVGPTSEVIVTRK